MLGECYSAIRMGTISIGVSKLVFNDSKHVIESPANMDGLDDKRKGGGNWHA